MKGKPPKITDARKLAEAEAREMIEAMDWWTAELGKMLEAATVKPPKTKEE